MPHCTLRSSVDMFRSLLLWDVFRIISFRVTFRIPVCWDVFRILLFRGTFRIPVFRDYVLFSLRRVLDEGGWPEEKPLTERSSSPGNKVSLHRITSFRIVNAPRCSGTFPGL